MNRPERAQAFRDARLTARVPCVIGMDNYVCEVL